MTGFLFRVGSGAARHPWRVLGAWVVVVLAAVWLGASYGGASTEDFRLPGAESQRAADAMKLRLPQKSLFTSNVIFHADGGLRAPARRAAVERAVTDLSGADHVVAVADPFDTDAPTLSANGRTAFATVGYDVDAIGATEFAAAEAATRAARAAGVQVEYDGSLGYAEAAAEPNSELIAVGVAVLVLLIAFGSVVAMSLPIVVALVGILTGTSMIAILSGLFAVPKIAGVVGVMLGLGVGIDYALFVVSRYRQDLHAGSPVTDAVGRANATAGRSVLFAGVTVVVAIAGMQLSGIPMLAVMGWASALMVAVAMLAALTLLPALLGLVGRRIDRLRVPFLAPRPGYDPRSRAARATARVVSRPLRYGLTAAAVLVVLAVPAFSMRLGFADSGNDGPSTTTRKAYDLLAQDYGPGFNGPLAVVVQARGAARLTEATLRRVSDAVRAEPAVASVGRPVVNDDATLAVLDVTPTTGPQEEETVQLLRRLRERTLPGAVAGRDAEAMVTGTTAVQDDVSRRLAERMIWFLAAVLGLSVLTLMAVFRSVWIPLKAAALNVLSVGAAYGVVVAVFQWGWGAGLIGLQETVPIMPLAPMLMFAILFGLSMDYEVFLISRVREQYLRHGDPHRAVVEGVGSTARVITSAALIMISVFGTFVLAGDVTTKMFGVGLAVAVLLDVTLVRMILVPAAMSLLAERAWWIPVRLEQRRPGGATRGAGARPPADRGRLTPV